MVISKRFPANTSMEVKTFLNDKSINGELYAYLQSISQVKDEVTFVDKKKLPTQTEICKIIGIKSTKTYRAHLNNLIKKGFIIENKKNNTYELPRKENIYFLIPLKTLQFLNDTLTENVIKVYVYLGQRFKYAESQKRIYEFTLEEIGTHIGYNIANYSRGYTMINNILSVLSETGLIKYETYYNGKTQKRKLLEFNFR